MKKRKDGKTCTGEPKPDPLPHYEICRKCAIAKGGKPVSWAVTVWTGDCPYCNKPSMLCSTRDYDWPKLGMRAVWD